MPRILVTSRTGAADILMSPSRRSDVAFVLSIGEARENPPAGLANVKDKLRLLFPDTIDESGASEDDIRRIIAIADRLKLLRGSVLVHCQSGISRSSAAAYLHSEYLVGGRSRAGRPKSSSGGVSYRAADSADDRICG